MDVDGSHKSKDGRELLSSDLPLSANVENIFKVRPLPYKGPHHGSGSTRGPAFHDEHLSQALLLKKAVFCPNFVDQLGRVAEIALREAHLPDSIGPGWKLASKIRSELLEKAGSKLSAEADVVAAYQSDVFSRIVHTASVLEFPSSSWRVQFMELTKSDSTHLDGKAKKGRKSKYALADSILTINPDLHEESIPSKTLEEMKIIAKYFKTIIPFEFKSLTSGSYGAMLAILGHTLLEVFPWQSCCAPYCAYEHGPKLGRRPVTGDPSGFDAANMGIQLHISAWTGSHRQEFERTGHKEKGKNTMHGRNMLQQIWAKMVKCDATYAVLNAGNYELVFLRRRETQTLCISDIIEPHTPATGHPGHYQVHIGLYIAAIRDARSRARQLEDFRGQKHILPDTWTRPYDCGYGRYKPAEIPKPEFDDVISNYPELCLGLAKGNRIPNPRFTAYKPYRRSGCPTDLDGTFFFLEVDKIISTTEYVGIMIVQGHSFTSRPVVIKVANDQNATSKLYEEYQAHLGLLAKHDETNQKLKHDMMIQRPYGFFMLERSAGSEDNFNSVLLLEYAGEKVLNLSHLTRFQKSSIRRTLMMVHQLGFVHGALKRRKIRVDDTQEVWLTDLSRVRRGKRLENGKGTRQGTEADEELRKLSRWLKYPKKNNPSPSHPVELGPISFRFDDANAAFRTITTWMVQELWSGTAQCLMKDDIFGNTWLVAKFFSEEHVQGFMAEWCSSRRPADLHDVQCVDTFFNQESQALSPPPGPDVEESSQSSDYD